MKFGIEKMSNIAFVNVRMYSDTLQEPANHHA
jgi:hypothetical protein